MAIKPSSDIVLEVLKAADPLRAQATTQRLQALGAGSVEDADDFAKALDATAQPPAASPEVAPNAANMRDRLDSISLDAANDQKAARTQLEFEASILKTFVDAILPKDESDVYGQGTAGDIWKSMLADQIARQIAKSGAFGISKRLFSSHPLPSHAHTIAAASGVLSDAAARGAGDSLEGGFRHGAFLSGVSNRS
ncbi:rod-binding protein [Methylocapsa sp. S129]|uniref:rod-binding protein n=1 Tax=Methylocapsa sp. S129 TaxID=1641869 RepID=UPI00131C2FEE|nr:rod-binding protein [Methylocapsa sp. S129]